MFIEENTAGTQLDKMVGGNGAQFQFGIGELPFVFELGVGGLHQIGNAVGAHVGGEHYVGATGQIGFGL